MGKIIISPFADSKLQDLMETLYEKEYFGFRADAKKYVDGIYDFITNIPNHRKQSTKNNKYGQFYCCYKPNKNTAYYITFDTEDGVYLIKNIISSHTKEYPAFIKGI